MTGPRGIYPMLFAMFDAGGRLRRDAVRAQIAASRAAGADGIAVLGLGTEANRLSVEERRALVEWTAEDCGDDLPFCVSIGGASPDEQAEFAGFAEGAGASWVILQPPPEALDEQRLIAFFGAVADRLGCPVGVQNAPQFIGHGLSEDGLVTLARNHPNIGIAKAEAGAVEIRRLVERLDGRMRVFNGRAGLELTDNYRAGVVGMIPGVETVDLQVACARLMGEGREARAEALYREALPAIVFVMQGIDQFITYGKLLAALRLGLELDPQTRSGTVVHPFGYEIARRLAWDLGPLPREDKAA